MNVSFSRKTQKQVTYLHQPTAWLVPNPCAQPYHSDTLDSSPFLKAHRHGIAVGPLHGQSRVRKLCTGVKRLCHADEKQLSMAATTRWIWLCACVRYRQSRELVWARESLGIKFVSFSRSVMTIISQGLRGVTFVTTAMLNNTFAHRDSFVRTKDTHFVIHMTTTK